MAMDRTFSFQLRSAFGLGSAIFFMAQSTLAGVDLKGIPTARTTKESQDLYSLRRERVLDFFVKKEVPTFQSREGNGLASTATARMILGVDVETVNQRLLDPEAKIYAKVGTDIDLKICKRVGDYDFMLQNLMRILYVSKTMARVPLSKEAFDRALFELVPTKGNKPYTHFWLGICGRHRDTENHILMTESSRYLANQLLFHHPASNKNAIYNNLTNGMQTWMLNHLQQFFVTWFEEYNSRPYQNYTIMALQNLAQFAEDEPVRLKSQMILDMLNTMFMIASNQGRRSVPFRRQPAYDSLTSIIPGDSEHPRMALVVGQLQFLSAQNYEVHYGTSTMMAQALNGNEIEAGILDLNFHPPRQGLFQKLNHEAVEMYFKHQDFTLTAGGHYLNKLDYLTKEQDGWARPSVVIPSMDQNTDWNLWPRIEGHKERMKRQNTCVYRNMACGLNVVIPSHYPPSCLSSMGPWTLINLDKDCPLNLGIRLAVWKKDCRWYDCGSKAENFGLFEVRSSNEISREEFAAHIQKAPKKFSYHKSSSYKTSTGLEVEFDFHHPFIAKSLKWEISKINGKSVERNFSRWPLFQGDVLNVIEPGHITIDLPSTQSIIHLNSSRNLNPERKVLQL